MIVGNGKIHGFLALFRDEQAGDNHVHLAGFQGDHGGANLLEVDFQRPAQAGGKTPGQFRVQARPLASLAHITDGFQVHAYRAQQRGGVPGNLRNGRKLDRGPFYPVLYQVRNKGLGDKCVELFQKPGIPLSNSHGYVKALFPAQGLFYPVHVHGFRREHDLVRHKDIYLVLHQGLHTVGLRVNDKQVDIFPGRKMLLIIAAGRTAHPKAGKIGLRIQDQGFVFLLFAAQQRHKRHEACEYVFHCHLHLCY